MAVAVVVVLEVIEIEDRDAEGLRGMIATGGDGAVQNLNPAAAVGQLGQLVGSRQLVELGDEIGALDCSTRFGGEIGDDSRGAVVELGSRLAPADAQDSNRLVVTQDRLEHDRLHPSPFDQER